MPKPAWPRVTDRKLYERMKQKELEGKLYQYILRDETEENPEAQERREERLRKFEQYRRKFGSRHRIQHEQFLDKKLMMPTYSESLPELLRIADLSLVEFYQLGDVEVPFPFPEFPDIVGVCDSLSPSCRARMKELAMALSNDWWKEYSKNEQYRPSKRAIEVFLRVVPLYERATITPEGLLYATDDTTKNRTVPAESFPEVAQFLGISLHWITCMPDDIRCFGQYADTDIILDAFSFMSPATKRAFMASALYERECEVTNENA